MNQQNANFEIYLEAREALKGFSSQLSGGYEFLLLVKQPKVKKDNSDFQPSVKLKVNDD